MHASAAPSQDAHKIHRPIATARLWTIDVFVVEDDEADRALITNVLKRHPQVRAVNSTDAPELALAELKSAQRWPDLILLDVNMPRLNGFQLLEQMRLIPAMREAMVVVLTTSRLARDVQEACTSGVAFYIVKPDSYEELQTRLNTVVDHALAGVRAKQHPPRAAEARSPAVEAARVKGQ